MKPQRTIIERLEEIKNLIALAEHDKLPKSQMRVFTARYETLRWVLEDDR